MAIKQLDRDGSGSIELDELENIADLWMTVMAQLGGGGQSSDWVEHTIQSYNGIHGSHDSVSFSDMKAEADKLLPKEIPYRELLKDSIARLAMDVCDRDKNGAVTARSVSPEEWERVVREMAKKYR